MKETPPISDPYWLRTTMDLRVFLSERRTWRELVEFTRREDVSVDLLRQQLAYLEDRRLAVALENEDGSWSWQGKVYSLPLGASKEISRSVSNP